MGRPKIDGNIKRIEVRMGETMMADLGTIVAHLASERGVKVSVAEALRWTLAEQRKSIPAET